jgi:hypothetical protein
MRCLLDMHNHFLCCVCVQKEILTAQAKTLPHGHRVHFTPDFSFDEASQTRYPYYNKPFGLQHFLKYASPPIAESVIVLTDPDFVMMKPFTPFLDETTQYYKGNSAPAIVPPATRPAVTEGFPVGQVSVSCALYTSVTLSSRTLLSRAVLSWTVRAKLLKLRCLLMLDLL